MKYESCQDLLCKSWDARIDTPARDWSFLSNHGLALLCITRDPDARIP